MGKLLAWDFQCDEGHVTEHLVTAVEMAVDCPECGGLAKRMLAAPSINLDGCSGDFPTAADKWVRLRESRMKQERRNLDRHGTTYLDKPNSSKATRRS